MTYIVAYETRRERAARTIKSFIRLFRRYENWHSPLGAILFLAAVFSHYMEGWALIGEGVIYFLFGCYAICWITVLLFRAVYKPYPLPPKVDYRHHVLDGFVRLPPDLKTKDCRYHFRHLAVEMISEGWNQPKPSDLEVFVDFSDLSLGEAHSDLPRDERRQLYLRWWEKCPEAFLLLDRRETDRAKRLVAMTIVLPLSQQGYQVLRSGERSIIELGKEDIAALSESSPYLLIDTWIICPAYRHQYTGYEYALVLKHLSLFWNPVDQQEMTILVEPDVRSVSSMAKASNFAGPTKTKDGGKLYSFRFPMDYADDRLAKRLSALKDNVTNLRLSK